MILIAAKPCGKPSQSARGTPMERKQHSVVTQPASPANRGGWVRPLMTCPRRSALAPKIDSRVTDPPWCAVWLIHRLAQGAARDASDPGRGRRRSPQFRGSHFIFLCRYVDVTNRTHLIEYVRDSSDLRSLHVIALNMSTQLTSPTIEARAGTCALSTVDAHNWTPTRRLACGRYTEVFQARPAQAGDAHPCDYALKLARKDAPPQVGEMLAVEAQVGASVSHPNLIPVLSAHLSPDRPFLVLPFLEGATLNVWAHQARALGVGTMLWFLRQATEALDCLHQAGWSHGDIKPANMMVGPTGHATLLDLSFARPVASPQSARQPSTQSLALTPRYAAPELLEGACNPRQADVYSMALTVLEVLAKVKGLTPEVIHTHWPDGQGNRLLPLLKSELPVEFARLLASGLNRDPAVRPTAEEFAARLFRLEIAIL